MSNSTEKANKLAPKDPSTKAELKQGQEEHMIDDIGPADVLLGRGAGPNEHSGNVGFRMLVKQEKPRYLRTNNRKAKNSIARGIISSITKRRGRFLNRAQSKHGKEMFIEADSKVVLEKTKQALRHVDRASPDGFVASASASDGGLKAVGVAASSVATALRLDSSSSSSSPFFHQNYPKRIDGSAFTESHFQAIKDSGTLNAARKLADSNNVPISTSTMPNQFPMSSVVAAHTSANSSLATSENGLALQQQQQQPLSRQQEQLPQLVALPSTNRQSTNANDAMQRLLDSTERIRQIDALLSSMAAAPSQQTIALTPTSPLQLPMAASIPGTGHVPSAQQPQHFLDVELARAATQAAGASASTSSLTTTSPRVLQEEEQARQELLERLMRIRGA